MKIWPICTLYNLSNVWCNKNRTKHSSVLLMPWFDFHCIRRYVYHNEVTSFLKTQSHFFSCIFVSFFANLVFLYFCNRRLHEYNMTMQVHESRNAPSTKSPSIVYLLVQQNVAQKSFYHLAHSNWYLTYTKIYSLWTFLFQTWSSKSGFLADAVWPFE